MIKKNFKTHLTYLKNICEKVNIDYKSYEYGFVIYPDGYGDEQNKNYFLLMINQENHFEKLVPIRYKDCSDEELITYLIEFKNGIINNDFCLNNIVNYTDSIEEDFEYVARG